MESTSTRPEFCTDDMLVFLDELRESGKTNMFGAGPYLKEMFPELTGHRHHDVLGYWMESFGKETR